jgi:hypothetical protein
MMKARQEQKKWGWVLTKPENIKGFYDCKD